MTATNIDTRPHLAVALDVDDLREAVRICNAVSPHIGVAKVGLQLFSAEGPRAVQAIRDTGLSVFLDVKLHDIPNTVRAAARILGSLGAQFLTIHASGGEAMMQAAVEGLTRGATDAGLTVPTTLAVLILTSHQDAPATLLTERLTDAVRAGSPGVVCAATDLPTVRATAPDIFVVTPGIRMPGGDTHDQARVSTPGEAIAKGANLLVIGRAVTAAPDPASAAAEIAADVQASLATLAARK